MIETGFPYENGLFVFGFNCDHTVLLILDMQIENFGNRCENQRKKNPTKMNTGQMHINCRSLNTSESGGQKADQLSVKLLCEQG